MAATLATVAAISKELYEPRLRKQLNDDAVTIKRVLKSSDGVEDNVGGKFVNFPIKTRRNAGIGARNEMELLPTPGQQGYAAARVGLKYLYGGIQLSGQTIRLVDSNAQAFVSALDSEIEGLRTDLAKDQNRMVYGDATGAIAVCLTVGTGTNTFIAKSAMYAQLGEQVDIILGSTIGNTTPTVVASNRQITAINVSTNTITFDGATANTAVGDLLVRTGSVKREWIGLAAIVSDVGTLYNIDPNTEPIWKAEVDSNSGTNRALSENLLTLMNDRIRTNGGKVTAMFSNLGVRRAYATLLQQQRRYTNTTEFTGGFGGLAFTTDHGDIPFVVDIDAPKNTVWFVNEAELTVYREKDWSWMDMDGAMWNRVTGYDAYAATMIQYSELGCHRRNTFGVIKDITEG